MSWIQSTGVMRRAPHLVIIVALIVSVGLSRTASAQSSATGTIAGVVRDTSGAVLPGATVEVASPVLIEKVRSVTTDERGQYAVVDLRPGVYEVTFSLAGFKSVVRPGIELTTGFTAQVSAELPVGALEETLTVTGASPVVDIRNTQSQKVLSRETLDAVPTGQSLHGYTSLTLGASTSGADVGGNKSEAVVTVSIHGTRGADQKWLMDGMGFNQLNAQGAGTSRYMFVNQLGAQEVTLETSGMGETTTGGIQLNVVPKEGGSRFSGVSAGAYSGPKLQNQNISQELRDRGLTGSNSVRRIYDIGAAVGGPLVKDRLHFFSAHRWWGASEYVPSNFFNATPHTLFYTPDLSRPAYTDVYNQDNSLRLTWQATSKQRFTGYYARQDNCLCYFQVESNRAPEATFLQKYPGVSLTQTTWTYPVRNTIMLQAGLSVGDFFAYGERDPSLSRTDISVTDATTGYLYGPRIGNPATSRVEYGRYVGDNTNGRMSISYVTGSHQAKVGFTFTRGLGIRDYEFNDPPVSYTFRNCFTTGCQPVSVTYYSSPHYVENVMREYSLYAQDQWTVSRLTLNLGVRYDQMHAWAPAQTKPAGRFVGELSSAKIDNVPNWKDISPRMGIAYDIFGNGKTALKASLGRYLGAEAMTHANANSPANSIVGTASRNWTDTNTDFVPQDSELAPLSNNLFGTLAVSQRYDSDVLLGWGTRDYSWQGSVAVQHELRPGLGVLIGYYRTSYGNFTVTDDLSRTPTDYQEYCVNAPTDTRLPDDGGYPICGLFEITRAAFGQAAAGTLVAKASKYGERREIFDGMDFGVSGRMSRGITFSGGVSTGRTVNDNCLVVDSPQLLYCKTVNPWAGQTQVKLSGVIPLPWGIQGSGVFQNLPGLPISATRPFSNAEVAPNLGRNLSACSNQTGACTAQTAAIPLIEPFTQREARLTQIDVRLTKNLTLGRTRLRAMFDMYNALNANTILVRNNTFGSTWGRPTSILAARTFKFGAEYTF